MSNRFSRAVVFVEPLPTHPLGEKGFLTSATRIIPPEGLFQTADSALGLEGQLVSWARHVGTVPLKKIRFMSDSEKDELFWQESKGHQWSTWFASTQPTHRYNVLVIYEENAVETAVDRLEGMARGDNLEEIMSMLREGHSKEDVLSAVVEGRLGHEQPEESIRERNRKKEASEKQTFQCVMCKEYLEIHATSEHMKSHADRIIEEMKVDIRREYDVLWNKIKTQFDEVRGELGLKKQE